MHITKIHCSFFPFEPLFKTVVQRKVYKAYISERKGPKHGFLICLWFYVRRKFERHEELDTGMRRTSRLSRHVYHWTNKQAFKWWLLCHNIKTWYLYPRFEISYCRNLNIFNLYICKMSLYFCSIQWVYSPISIAIRLYICACQVSNDNFPILAVHKKYSLRFMASFMPNKYCFV